MAFPVVRQFRERGATGDERGVNAEPVRLSVAPTPKFEKPSAFGLAGAVTQLEARLGMLFGGEAQTGAHRAHQSRAAAG